MSVWHDVLARAEQNLHPERPIDEALASLDDVTLPSATLIHLAFVVQRHPIAVLLDQMEDPSVAVQLVARHAGCTVYRVALREGLPGDLSTLPLRVDSLGNEIALLTAVGTTRQWRDVADRLLRLLYPAIYRPFLRQSELRDIFSSIQSRFDVASRLRFTRVSSVKRMLQRDSRRDYESGLVWTDVDFEQAFASAEEDIVYFRNVKFELCSSHRVKHPLISSGIHGTGERNAHFSINKRADLLHASISATSRSRAASDHGLAQNRGRMVGSIGLARPILASFQDRMVLDSDNLSRLATVFRLYQSSSASITHGNPYLDITVVDFLDGSVFDLVVASQEHLLIVPHLRATESAVIRLCQFIYERVGDAEFVDAGSLRAEH